MVKAIERHFQGAVWQRCQVHFVRNALALCVRRQRPPVLRLMKAVTESATREAAASMSCWSGHQTGSPDR
jgi:transposase-like protein